MNREELDILKELSEKTYFGDLPFLYYADLIGKLLTAYEKEKEKNKELTERVLKLESDKFWDNVISKNKIKQIIYPTPENEIPIEVQQSEMYKKLVKEVEE